VADGVNTAKRMLKGLEDAHGAIIVTGDGVPRNCVSDRPAADYEAFAAVIAQTLPVDPKARVHTVYVGRTRVENGVFFFRLLAATHGGEFRQSGLP
jgi:hypothetical protein